MTFGISALIYVVLLLQLCMRSTILVYLCFSYFNFRFRIICAQKERMAKEAEIRKMREELLRQNKERGDSILWAPLFDVGGIFWIMPCIFLVLVLFTVSHNCPRMWLFYHIAYWDDRPWTLHQFMNSIRPFVSFDLIISWCWW